MLDIVDNINNKQIEEVTYIVDTLWDEALSWIIVRFTYLGKERYWDGWFSSKG